MRQWLLLLAVASCSRSERKLALDWLSVEAGDTKLGCDRWPAAYADGRNEVCIDYEFPHTARVAAFEALRDLVVHADYAQCVDAGVCTTPVREWVPAPDIPSDDVLARLPIAASWEQAQAFCAWIHASLPSIDQWERLARGNGDALYPWGDAPPSCAVAPAYVAEEFGPLIPCKLQTQDHYPASPLGAHALWGWGGEWTDGQPPPRTEFTANEIKAAARVDGDVGTFDPSKVEAIPVPQKPSKEDGIVKGLWDQTIGQHSAWHRWSPRVFRCIRPPQPAR